MGADGPARSPSRLFESRRIRAQSQPTPVGADGPRAVPEGPLGTDGPPAVPADPHMFSLFMWFQGHLQD
eukprot:9494146-Pyramimonas_sp.AAC.1